MKNILWGNKLESTQTVQTYPKPNLTTHLLLIVHEYSVFARSPSS